MAIFDQKTAAKKDSAPFTPDLPPFPVPAGHDEASWLVELVEIEGRERYGPRPAPGREGPSWGGGAHAVGERYL